MALLSTFIDVRTLAALATSGSSTYSHGLGAAPDFVFVQPELAGVLSSGSNPAYAAQFDGTNVTVYNFGQVTSTATLRVMAIRAHSVIR